MDFFERQERAHRNTRWLVVYFVLGVALLIAAMYFLVVVAFVGNGYRHHHDLLLEQPRLVLWNPKLFLGVSLGTLAVILVGSISKTIELSQGGSVVSTMMGGRLVSPGTTDLDERKLLNVVEEMALASGIPVPQVYVIDDENGINAFAAGHTTSDATVTVTRGCMKLLARDELQGVIAHEFSHVLNGDMRLNIRLMGMIFGILCIAIVGRFLLNSRSSRNSRERNPLPLIGLVLMALGAVGVFFGRLIQAGVCRQREFLADASAVQFTRNPNGIVSALKKIGGLGPMGSRLSSAHASEVSHMFFGNGMADPFVDLLATHPPLRERIRAIDPNFDGHFPAVRYAPEEQSPYSAFQSPELAAAMTPTLVPPAIGTQSIMPALGVPTTAHLQYADQLRNSIPANVQLAARDPLGASAVIYGLLIGNDPALRAKQLELLEQNTSGAVRQETERLLADVADVGTHAKLPLVDLTLPALRNFSPTQYEQFSRAIQALIEADGEIDLFEYVLQKITLRHLDPHFSGARKTIIQYYSITPLADDCAILLSTLAHIGSDDPALCQAAFEQGVRSLGDFINTSLTYVSSDQCELTQLDVALNKFSQSSPQIKKNVLTACAQVVAADGIIQETEAELLRAIADTLDCPIPPFLQPQS